MSFYDRDNRAPEPAAELKKLTGQVHNALSALKDAVDSKNEVTEKKVRDFFDKYEDLNQKFTREWAEFKKAQKDETFILRHRVQELEGENGAIHHKGFDWNKPGRDSPEYRAFFTFLTKGKQEPGLDWKTLRTDSESAGGYLIPQVMDDHIRKNIIETSPIRAHARVRVATGKTMDVPRRLSVPIAAFEGEAESARATTRCTGLSR
jgi:HK97 family phage major capsid protein